MEKAKNSPIPIKCFDVATGKFVARYRSISRAQNFISQQYWKKRLGETGSMKATQLEYRRLFKRPASEATIAKIANANPRLADDILQINPEKFARHGEYIWIWAELKD